MQTRVANSGGWGLRGGAHKTLCLPETKLAETKAETKLAETKLAETKLAETKLAETKLAETKLAETKLAETKLADAYRHLCGRLGACGNLVSPPSMRLSWCVASCVSSMCFI